MASEDRIKKLQEFLANDPNDSFTRYALAMEYNGLNDIELAITTLRELIERDPNYIAAYHQLGLILAKLNRTDEAKPVYRKGIDVAVLIGEEKEQHEMEEELEDIEDEW